MTEEQPTDRLSNIETTLGRVDERLKALCDRLEVREKRENQLQREVYGHNGTQGLVTKVALLRAAQARARWAIRAILGAALTALVSAIWSLLAK